MGSPRILLAGGGTGGHLYPALNLAAALRELEPEVELLLVGSERGVEKRVLPERDIPYRLLPMQPLYRSRPWRNVRLLTAAPAVVWKIRETFRSFRPNLVVGTGGYASAPAVAWAIATRVPAALQEQNAYPGLVTRVLSRRVDQLHLGYPEALAHLTPGARTEVQTHGNPVAPRAGRRTGSDGSPASGYAWPAGRIVLVFGGSQGARGINQALIRSLDACGDWPAETTIVWVTGPAHADSICEALRGSRWTERIEVLPYIEDLGAQLHHADLAIARAGAMSLAEVTAAGLPVVLVPLPTSAAGHQLANARALAEAGAAVVREESELTDDLWSVAAGILEDPERLSSMAAASAARGAPEAARHIAADLLRLAGGGSGDDR